MAITEKIARYIKALIQVIFFVFISITTTYANTIKIAAIDWCPQICLDVDKPGYTVDLIKEVFKDSKYTLVIDVFPWTRAIQLVSNGHYDALLAPAKKEAPNLIFPDIAVGYQQMCFFTDKKNTWLYTGENSLKDMQIGIANDTSIEELNNYINKHPTQFQYQPYHERYVMQNAGKVLKKRIDAFLFTKNTTAYVLKKEGLNHKIRNAGCVSQTKIFLAFTPLPKKKTQINEVIKYFDNNMKMLIETNVTNTIFDKYDIEQATAVHQSIN